MNCCNGGKRVYSKGYNKDVAWILLFLLLSLSLIPIIGVTYSSVSISGNSGSCGSGGGGCSSGFSGGCGSHGSSGGCSSSGSSSGHTGQVVMQGSSASHSESDVSISIASPRGAYCSCSAGICMCSSEGQCGYRVNDCAKHIGWSWCLDTSCTCPTVCLIHGSSYGKKCDGRPPWGCLGGVFCICGNTCGCPGVTGVHPSPCLQMSPSCTCGWPNCDCGYMCTYSTSNCKGSSKTVYCNCGGLSCTCPTATKCANFSGTYQPCGGTKTVYCNCGGTGCTCASVYCKNWSGTYQPCGGTKIVTCNCGGTSCTCATATYCKDWSGTYQPCGGTQTVPCDCVGAVCICLPVTYCKAYTGTYQPCGGAKLVSCSCGGASCTCASALYCKAWTGPHQPCGGKKTLNCTCGGPDCAPHCPPKDYCKSYTGNYEPPLGCPTDCGITPCTCGGLGCTCTSPTCGGTKIVTCSCGGASCTCASATYCKAWSGTYQPCGGSSIDNCGCAAAGFGCPQTGVCAPLNRCKRVSDPYHPCASFRIWTYKTSYKIGETMKVYVRVRNPAVALPVRALIYLKLPSGALYGPLLDMKVTIPAGYDSGDVLWQTFTIPSAPLGNYCWIAELRNPTTGALICSSTWWWRLQAVALTRTPSTKVILQAKPEHTSLSVHIPSPFLI